MAREKEAARYHRAARMALDQLDWCIDYLRREHKPRVARKVARNRAAIGQRLDEQRRKGNG